MRLLIRRLEGVEGGVAQLATKLLPAFKQFLFLVQKRDGMLEPAHGHLMKPFDSHPPHHRWPAQRLNHALQTGMEFNIVQESIDSRGRVRILDEVLPVHVPETLQRFKWMGVPHERVADHVHGDRHQLPLDVRQQTVAAKESEAVQKLGVCRKNQAKRTHCFDPAVAVNRSTKPTSTARCCDWRAKASASSSSR